MFLFYSFHLFIAVMLSLTMCRTDLYCLLYSTLVRGVVCSKNVKHKRMVSEHKSAKLLILGGALEYHRVTNKLASIGTILEQVCSYSYACYMYMFIMFLLLQEKFP
jgi:hypothetical protein